jgi:hypothetical protein
MRLRTTGATLAGLGLIALACSGPPADSGWPAPPLPPVAGPEAPGLPPLPERSPRNASYAIEARLDPQARTIEGSLVLEWRNTSDQAHTTFPFHLYWNAFRNTFSTTARGRSRRWSEGEKDDDRSFGWIQVRRVRRLGQDDTEEDLSPSLRYVHPDGNEDDRTVMEVSSETPVAPGETARFAIEWDARIPHGTAGRAGWVHDYHFIAQWFPKIGVFWKGEWNCHPFYAWTEFFSDYGVYDVRLTVPRGFVVGATGRREERSENADGTETLRYVQEDVHDFAWTASRRFLERSSTFDDRGYPPVKIRLLLQPEHAHLAERYLEATKIALRTYGTWSAPYPYAQITVVDPAWGSSSGGMEYPTFLTGGASVVAPAVLQSPEGVTIHEAGHQFWYGLVGNNEFEEAWLDEGFTTYMTVKAQEHSLGPEGLGHRYFGGSFGRGAMTGWPVVAPGVWIPRGSDLLSYLRNNGEKDPMARPAWTYRDRDSYGTNSYDKPALTLQTLEGLVGEETMVRILRTFARRYRFAHPSTEDLIAVVGEVTGQDWRWFFEETFFSSGLCDYAVTVETRRVRTPRGWLEGPDGELALGAPAGEETDTAGSEWTSRVTVARLGEVRMPVEVRVTLADGRSIDELWDGRDRWTRFEYTGAKAVVAIVDPEGKIAVDVDRSNNEWMAKRGPARRAATKWAARWMFWLQNLLELHMVVG